MTKSELILELIERQKIGFYVPPYDVLLSIYKDDEEVDVMMVGICYHQPQPRDIDVFMGKETSDAMDKALKEWIDYENEK